MCSMRPSPLPIEEYLKAIVATIKGIPEDTWLVDYLQREHDITICSKTIQIVLDTLEQKCGLS